MGRESEGSQRDIIMSMVESIDCKGGYMGNSLLFKEVSLACIVIMVFVTRSEIIKVFIYRL